MSSFNFDSTILGSINCGQAIVTNVEGKRRPMLRSLKSIARHLSLLASWRHALRGAAGAFAMFGDMTPATCPSYRTRRQTQQRSVRWLSGVVVDPGTVGVC